MNSSNFKKHAAAQRMIMPRKFVKSLILALLSFSLVIPYYLNFRFNEGSNMPSVLALACFLCQFVILEACSCLKNDRDTVNLVSH